MTLFELYGDPKKTMNWFKCAEKILVLETANHIELIDARGIFKRYRLMCRRAQILSAKAFIFEQMSNESRSQQIELMIKTIGVLEKVKKRAE